MAGPMFLNTNIILRHLTRDHAELSPRATALIRRIALGELSVRTADTVIFEAVYTLQRLYRVPRAEIRRSVLDLLALPGIQLRGKRRYERVFDLYVAYPALSFADCYHVALMESAGITDLLSFDRDMDRVPTIRRKAPDAGGAIQ
jgi:uncharacterized protein